MAEWLRRGLQILARRFDSGSGLQISFYRLRANGLNLPTSPKFILLIDTSCHNGTAVSYPLNTTVLFQNILFAFLLTIWITLISSLFIASIALF